MPQVSIIIPCFNEQSTIQLLLEAIRTQSYPVGDMEIIISDGMSTDQTKHVILEYQQSHPELNVRIVDNTKRTIPSSLNRAIEAAQGEFIVRLDAHSIPDSRYVEHCVNDLKHSKGDNVGGVWEILPGGDGWIAKSIAMATAHPLGVGDARYRLPSTMDDEGKSVDTVPFGSYKRSLFTRIGTYDEELLANEDYEFNARIIKSGGSIWMNPSIRSIYFSRNTFNKLLKQYWRYGFWKWYMIRRYPSTLKWRQALPPVFVISLLLLLILSPLWWGRLLLGTVIAMYFIVLVVGVMPSVISNKNISLLFGMPLAITIMHVSWGAGFIWGITSSCIDWMKNLISEQKLT